ncbi:SRPBCC family protein [Thermomonospora umbrina]|uniref:Polyketide cyclase/dehydrase/lipid transport protein n=1 Tax=Thermomonospora umbrina TaxID=111806 RepID=A0A3D9SP67_9ACTN|nr:SRPBCC family protein [Thermomonospora umbrina]REE97698.1 polyketide cyclase/dehydrase/lipid transport protein [Thermomonospora umbrina]
MSGPQYRLTGRITVPLPPARAFELFTPRGEQRWVPGWRPRFPLPTDDDTAPGTVFETTAADEVTTWVVLSREPGHHISYARVTPGSRAGTVTVSLTENTTGHTTVDVTYELTALTPTAEPALHRFATDYPTFLHTWQEALTTAT